MKILHLSLMANSGEEVYVANLVKHQAKFAEVNNRSLIGLKNTFNLNKEIYVSVLESMQKSLSLLDMKDLASYDVFNCHAWHTALSSIALKTMFPEKKLVFFVHALVRSRPWRKDSMGASYDLACFLDSLVLKAADHIVVSSTGSNQELKNYLSPSEMKKVVQIVPGVNHVFQEKQTLDPKFSFVQKNTKPFIFIGRGSRQKGIEYIVKAAQYIQSNAKIYLLIGKYEDAEYKNELEQMISQYPNKIIYKPLSWTSQEQVAAIMQNSYAFCSPSVFETFGLTAAEANMAGLPVIGTNIQGTADIIINGNNGFLIDVAGRHVDQIARDFAEKIDLLYTNENLALELKHNALNASKRYSWDRAALDLMNLYKQPTHRLSD